MAEAGLAAYGAAIGVGLYLAVLAFILRQKRPHGPDMETQFKGETATSEPTKEEPIPEPTPEPAKDEPKTDEK